MPIARREEDSSPVIASVAKQSHKKRLRLPRRYAPRNQTVSQFKNMKKFDKNFPFKAIIKVNKHFRHSFLGRMFCLFPILNLAINCDTA
jgi:hypothetical protein